jgi:hypothetical protein
MRAAAVVAGGAAASAPVLALMALSPSRFFFGNLQYEAISVLYRQQVPTAQPMTMTGKLAYIWTLATDPANAPFALLAAGSLLIALWQCRPSGRTSIGLRLALLLQPFAFFAALAPTPAWPQYYFAPFVLVAFVVPYAVAALGSPATVRAVTVLAAVAAAWSFVAPARFSAAESVRLLTDASQWYPLAFHRQALELRDTVRSSPGGGRILTLAPALPAEVGLPIYPQFATGRFAWRTSHLLTEDERQAQLFVGANELRELVQRDPPRAVLVEGESDSALEVPLVEAARSLGLRPVSLSQGRTVWVARHGP